MPVIVTEAELRTLRTRVHRMSLGPEERTYTFHLPHAHNQENERLSILVSRYMNECGCSVGSFAMVLFFAASVSYYFLSGGTLHSATLDQWMLLAGLTFAGAATGKLVGLAFARWKLITLVRHAMTLHRHVINQHHQSFLQE